VGPNAKEAESHQYGLMQKKLVHRPLTVRKVSYITQGTAQSIFNVNKFTAKPNNESILKINQHLTTVKTKEQLQWPGCVTDPTGK